MTEATPGTASPPLPQAASFAVAVEDQALSGEIQKRLKQENSHSIRIIEDPTRLIGASDKDESSALIVSLPIFKQLAKHHGDWLTRFCQDHIVVLVIRSQDFLDSLSFLELAGGVVFADATLDCLPQIIPLAQSGYSILPSAAVMDIVSDRLRRDSIAKLNLLELSIIDQIRLAKTNRAIARALNLSEANVKTKVRAILKMLKFQNRTEAAVFAARQGEMIRRLLAERQTEGDQAAQEQNEDRDNNALH